MDSQVTGQGADSVGLDVGRMLPGLDDQRVEAIFRLAPEGALAALAVSDGVTVSILLQPQVVRIETDRRAQLDFFSEVLGFIGGQLTAQKIIVVGLGPSRAMAHLLLVELLRDYPKLRQRFALCVTPGPASESGLSLEARQLLAGIERIGLRPPAIARSGTALSCLKAGPERSRTVERLGPELRAALLAVPKADNPIAAYMRIASLVTPLPQPVTVGFGAQLRNWARRLLQRPEPQSYAAGDGARL